MIAYMKNPDINTEQMMQYIPGPDFPTGGVIANKDELTAIYSTGVGKIKIRGKVEVEQVKGGKERLVITEIPYTMIGANIGKFLNDVYSLVETKKTNDIVDITNSPPRRASALSSSCARERTLPIWRIYYIRRPSLRIRSVSICLRWWTEDRRRWELCRSYVIM